MFKTVGKEDFEALRPILNSEYYYNLDDDKKDEYVNLYNLYRKLFTFYIIKKFDLMKYEKYFFDSKFDFEKVQTREMDFYQWYSSEELDYFYIRNNVYLEQLNNEELEQLKSMEKNNESELTEKTEYYIEKTYKKAIFEKIRGDELIHIAYGAEALRNFHRNDSLVIGFRYDRFVENELDDKTWMNQDQAKVQIVQMVLNEMNKVYGNTLDIPFIATEYNRFSI